MKELQYQVDYIAKELKEIYNGEQTNEEGEEITLYDYISDTLDIEYTLNSSRSLIGVRLWVTLGGPNIYIDARNGEVVGHWGSDCARAWIPLEICEEINNYFDEIF
jgi:hypothetical protein